MSPYYVNICHSTNDPRFHIGYCSRCQTNKFISHLHVGLNLANFYYKETELQNKSEQLVSEFVLEFIKDLEANNPINYNKENFEKIG